MVGEVPPPPDTANMQIDLKFNLVLEWRDHRAEWVNLQEEEHL